MMTTDAKQKVTLHENEIKTNMALCQYQFLLLPSIHARARSLTWPTAKHSIGSATWGWSVR